MPCEEVHNAFTMPMADRVTYDSANWVLLCRGCLLDRVIDDKVKEKVITSKCSANFSATLKMDEKFFVHELKKAMT